MLTSESVNWLLNVTVNNIPVIYVMAHTVHFTNDLQCIYEPVYDKRGLMT